MKTCGRTRDGKVKLQAISCMLQAVVHNNYDEY